MNLIYIANVRMPTEKAHGHQIMKMGEVFVDAGATVELIVPNRFNPEYDSTTPFDYYKIKNNFKIKKLKAIDPYFLLRWPAGLYIKVQSAFFIFSLFWHFLFKRRKKDNIFYTRDEYLLPFLTMISKKVVWEVHALPSNLGRYGRVLPKCHKIVVLTQAIKDQLKEFDISEDKILVSPDAVDLTIFDIEMTKDEARKRLGLPQDKFILGYTGSFKTKGMDKGIADIFKALNKIKDNSKVVFVAVGGNEIETKFYRDLAKEEDVSKMVLFFKKVTQSELAIYQKAFDVLMMPFPDKLHYRLYMSPLKMFEYMAAKRPILATDLPAIREVLDHTCAYLAHPDDPESIAKGVEKMMFDSVYLQNISQLAYNKVGRYTWDKRAESIINFLIT